MFCDGVVLPPCPPPLDEIILGGGDGSGSLYTRTLGSQNHYLGVKAHGLYIYIKLQGVVPIMLLLRRRLYECYEWPYISRAGGIAELMATVWMMERSCVL